MIFFPEVMQRRLPFAVNLNNFTEYFPEVTPHL